MKRWLLFAGDNYYPIGGWDDFQADFDTKEEAFDKAAESVIARACDWAHIVDSQTKESFPFLK